MLWRPFGAQEIYYPQNNCNEFNFIDLSNLFFWEHTHHQSNYIKQEGNANHNFFVMPVAVRNFFIDSEQENALYAQIF
jgi:hypothetical protein